MDEKNNVIIQKIYGYLHEKLVGWFSGKISLRQNFELKLWRVLSRILPFALGACVHFGDQSQTLISPTVDFYVYMQGSSTENFTNQVREGLGRDSKWGRIGIAVVHPYTSDIRGEGPDKFFIPEDLFTHHKAIACYAKKMNVPLMIQFNGANWHDADVKSAYHRYWKTFNGGEFLSRYIDGRVNETIGQTERQLPRSLLERFIGTDPYSKYAPDTLIFTNSMYAERYQEARLNALELAAKHWKKIDEECGGAITAITTDSEVSNFSFRVNAKTNRPLQVGYEDSMTAPFCQQHRVKDCAAFFSKTEFIYETDLEREWFQFRAKNHRRFVQASVNQLRKDFPRHLIYTHQIPTLDSEIIDRASGHDFASPQSTAFVDGAFAGFTVYIYGGRESRFIKVLEEISKKAENNPWGFLEFNPGKNWKGSKENLAEFTHRILSLAHKSGVRLIAPLSWESNSLDSGINGSGVDEGIRKFLINGPL